MSPRWLFLAVVTPIGVIGRPVWRRRLGLRASRRAASYWRRRGDVVSVDDLRPRS